MAVTEAAPTEARLLASWARTGQRADLAGHVATHGPLPRLRPDVLIAEVARSGVTGRGGGGFPTAAKIETYRRRTTRTLAVNATESEPASHKDAVLLGVTPHLVLDGAQLAARLIGAERVAVCIHGGAPTTASVLDALEERLQARAGDLPTDVVAIPSGYVAGEATALSNYLATGRSAPVFQPDKAIPVKFRREGIILVQNAETLAHVALIARHGADWFRAAGAGDEAGTRLVTISGAVSRPGVYETPSGAPLFSVLAPAGPGAGLAGVLVGGYGGSFVATSALGLPFSPDGLAPAGAHPGAGVLVAVPSGICALGEVARLAHYLGEQSAGQCGPCVFGLPAIASDLVEIVNGRGRQATLDRLRHRLAQVRGRGGCGHPDGAVRMVRSALDVFASDVAAHLHRRTCGLPAPGALFDGIAP